MSETKLTEALRVLEKAQGSYINVIRHRSPTGGSSADIRHSAGEIKASAEEAMFEEFGALTFEHVNAMIAGLAALSEKETSHG